ncbi:MAG: RNA polymerase factor sigma-54 [Deltaproteobacteria bacterium]|nr:RNA polymerase factor sigma-54 [Deltaproteobacteria bacterium]
MALGHVLIQRQTQQITMTPQMQQALKYLLYNQAELAEEINQLALENPMLEQTPAADSAEAAGKAALADPGYDQTPDPAVQTQDQFAEAAGLSEDKIRNEIDWDSYLDEYSSAPSTALRVGSHEMPEETPGFETFVAAKTSLTDHLLEQWGYVAQDQADFRRGEHIIGNLNEDGYLAATVEEIAQSTACTVEETKETLKRVQTLDPAGVAARDLADCLRLQLERDGKGDSLAAAICRDGRLKLLEQKNIDTLCRDLEIEKDECIEILDLLRTLNPRPGQAYAWTDPITVIPDVFVKKVGEEYVVSINDDGLPKLRFSREYQKKLKDENTDEETKQYLRDKLSGAVFLIRSIHKRQQTIIRVTEWIVKYQREFLDYGVEYLKPLVLQSVATDLDLSQSTISRVTSNKYVDTPRGVFELKYFFDNSINRFHGASLSSESVKQRIKNLLAAETPDDPLSDQQLVEILQGSNIKIARRTVAKYREQLGLGSSSERKQNHSIQQRREAKSQEIFEDKDLHDGNNIHGDLTIHTNKEFNDNLQINDDKDPYDHLQIRDDTDHYDNLQIYDNNNLHGHIKIHYDNDQHDRLLINENEELSPNAELHTNEEFNADTELHADENLHTQAELHTDEALHADDKFHPNEDLYPNSELHADQGIQNEPTAEASIAIE